MYKRQVSCGISHIKRGLITFNFKIVWRRLPEKDLRCSHCCWSCGSNTSSILLLRSIPFQEDKNGHPENAMNLPLNPSMYRARAHIVRTAVRCTSRTVRRRKGFATAIRRSKQNFAQKNDGFGRNRKQRSSRLGRDTDSVNIQGNMNLCRVRLYYCNCTACPWFRTGHSPAGACGVVAWMYLLFVE